MTTLTKSQLRGLETALAHAKNENLHAAQKVTSSLIRCASKKSQQTVIDLWIKAIADSMDSDAFRSFGTFRYLPLDVQLKSIVQVFEYHQGKLEVIDVPGHKWRRIHLEDEVTS